MKTTHFPCVKGMMGDWIYYVTVMSVSDIIQYVQFAEQVVPNRDLDSMIQREVSKRSKQIAEYLRTHDQRFFGSLIVAAYDGEPKFLPIAFADAPVLSQLEGKIGILQFDGSEQYYAVDGQHRLAALKEVVTENSARYKTDEISVIVICHTKDPEGMARARRLFTTVNRYAKQTAKVTNIVMDEDDGIAIISRRLVREAEFFTHRVKILNKQQASKLPSKPPKLATGEAMQASDKQYLMAIGTFYNCNEHLLPRSLHSFFSKKQQVPDYEKLEEGYNKISQRWENLIDNISIWCDLRDTALNLDNSRIENGGHVLARPVGIASFTKAAGEAFDKEISALDVTRCVQKFSSLNQIPWAGLLWNTSAKRMLAGREREKVASDVWRLLMGLQVEYEAVNREWKAQIDPRNEDPELKLPNPAMP
ncbi:MAG: DGQHR domain-containing protein [Deltaproteobacteria bacterium]|nr:DGQHR domain-containing protein [Deltaproteobacteria bacterium]